MRCLVIEDDVDTAQYVCNGLRDAGHAVQSCDDGAAGLALAMRAEWDVIVLDRLLPGGIDGLSILARLRAASVSTPVLVLSALASVDERVRGLHGGADDYLTKPFALQELLARVEVLLRRAHSDAEPSKLQVADLVLDTRVARVTRDGRTIALQPREFRLLEYLMRNEGQLVTRAMLLESVWSYHFEPQTNVIDVQVSRLRGKVDKGFALPLIHTLRGSGYMLAAIKPAEHV